jgi:hypothetical protein
MNEEQQFLIRQAEAAKTALAAPEVTSRKWQEILRDKIGLELDYIRKRAFFGLPWTDGPDTKPTCFYGCGYYKDIFADNRVKLSVSFAKELKSYFDLAAMCTFSSSIINDLCGYYNVHRRFWTINPGQGVAVIPLRPTLLDNDFSKHRWINRKITFDEVDEETFQEAENLGEFRHTFYNIAERGDPHFKPGSLLVIATAAVGWKGGNGPWTKLNLTVVKPTDQPAADKAE